MSQTILEKETVVVKFAGDSGDGIQLIGGEFANNTAIVGNDLNTFPDFPAEIRAPQGTLLGVSGFQIHFGNTTIYTSGDECDVLVVMNAAGLKANLDCLKKNGIIIANQDGFNTKNLRLANYEENPLPNLTGYQVYNIPISKLNQAALKMVKLGSREKDRCKNMFILGFIYWLYNRDIESTLKLIYGKFKAKPNLLEANLISLKTGYKHGVITDTFNTRYRVKAANLQPGQYRSVLGNTALVIGLIAACQKAKLELFYASYPITPASDILHQLAKYKHYGVKTLQAEDEIASICAAIGASFAGSLGITGTSGPGMALKAEAMGLAVMLELPLIIINVQRAGPSTGMPTKTEQSDLLQALYGRSGECPLVVLAANTPSNCFDIAYEAVRLTTEYMVPVLILSDGYIANGAEIWAYPAVKDLQDINVKFATKSDTKHNFMPYSRDKNLVREWAIPGTLDLQHRIGGLEKDDVTGNVSYNPTNHEKMVKIRQAKIDNIAKHIPYAKIHSGLEKGQVLVIGWGSTYGVIVSAVEDLNAQNYRIGHIHLNYLNPLPLGLKDLISNFDRILIPEVNNGQLVKIIRAKFLVNAMTYNKIQGIPITKNELKNAILELIDQ